MYGGDKFMYTGEPERQERDWLQERPNDLKRLDQMEGWHISEGDPDIRGWSIVDQDNKNVGKVDDLFISEKAQQAIFMIVTHGGVFGVGGEKTLIPLDHVSIDRQNQQIKVHMSGDHIKNAPKYTTDTRDFGQFYDYWSGIRRPEEYEGRRMEEAETRGMREERVIPEVEEHLEARKRAEEIGEVEIRKKVETHPETVRGTVRKTRIRVMRREVKPGRAPEPGEQVLREGETIHIPIVEERLEAAKRGEVTGEVVIQPETIEEEKEVTGEVRKEHVEVERKGGGTVEEEEEEGR